MLGSLYSRETHLEGSNGRQEGILGVNSRRTRAPAMVEAFLGSAWRWWFPLTRQQQKRIGWRLPAVLVAREGRRDNRDGGGTGVRPLCTAPTGSGGGSSSVAMGVKYVDWSVASDRWVLQGSLVRWFWSHKNHERKQGRSSVMSSGRKQWSGERGYESDG